LGKNFRRNFSRKKAQKNHFSLSSPQIQEFFKKNWFLRVNSKFYKVVFSHNLKSQNRKIISPVLGKGGQKVMRFAEQASVKFCGHIPSIFKF